MGFGIRSGRWEDMAWRCFSEVCGAVRAGARCCFVWTGRRGYAGFEMGWEGYVSLWVKEMRRFEGMSR